METTVTADRAAELVTEAEPAPSQLDTELGRTYTEIATLSELVEALDRRTHSVQRPDRSGFAAPTDPEQFPADELSPAARAVREQGDQVQVIANLVRTIIGSLQT